LLAPLDPADPGGPTLVSLFHLEKTNMEIMAQTAYATNHGNTDRQITVEPKPKAVNVTMAATYFLVGRRPHLLDSKNTPATRVRKATAPAKQ
jgi:hypothetical protein